MRNFLLFALLFIPIAASADANSQTKFSALIETLEKNSGGRIGVAAFKSENGERLQYRSEERFAMCSTFKLLLVAKVLARVDAGEEKLERMISFGKSDIQIHSPVAEKYLAAGKMSVADLSAAAIQYSDNAAANLLLKSIGGPQALTKYLRALGDGVTRLDRYEPALNSNIPGDPRDTTTPSAMLETLRKLLIGDALTAKSRDQLNAWISGNATGDKRLRAGLNPDWKIGDRTGTGHNGAAGDVAIVWPPGHPPFLIVAYISRAVAEPDQVIGQVGRAVSASFYPEQ